MKILDQEKAVLRLFKGYIDTYKENDDFSIFNDIKNHMLTHALITDNLEELPSTDIVDYAIELYGKDGEKWNKTFHKSFSTVRDMPIQNLIAQQLIHYFTTYGLEELGLYNKDLVYIPYEKLEIPELEQDVPFIVLHKISEDQLKEKLMTLLVSGIALSEETVNDIMILSDYIDLTKINDIKNREVKSALYEKYNIAPSNNIEFLRYVIMKTTGSTLLIQNKSMIETIKNLDNEKFIIAYNLFANYISNKNGYKNLAEIFLRYKNLFLAFKSNDKDKYALAMNKIINRISKLSKTYHKPLEANILDHLYDIKNTDDYNEAEDNIINELSKITIFRQIRILNGLNYRMNNTSNYSVYKIRNGKGFVKTTDSLSTSEKRAIKKVYSLILNNLLLKLEPLVKDKKVYIPQNVTYTAPQSEKQFNGNIPEGSYIECNREHNMVLGIAWKNLPNERVDLDLHMQNRNEQYGWNSSYRSNDSDFYFSGDITDAPDGATELFYIGKTLSKKSFLLTVNDYTDNDAEVPFQFVIANTDTKTIDRNYVLDPNNILIQVENNFKVEENKKTLGLVEINSKSIKFYFNDMSLGSSIISRRSEVSLGIYSYLEEYSKYQLTLNDLLKEAGAEMLDKPYTEELIPIETEVDGKTETLYKKVIKQADLDLSLESIDKESIIKLFMEAK